MRLYVDHIFDLGDMGEHRGIAEGSVELVTEMLQWGLEIDRLDIRITKAEAVLVSRDEQMKVEIDVLPFIDNYTRNSIKEAIEEKYQIAMSKEQGA
jgi:hypothetical protein